MDGKVLIVTGAGRGIGREMALLGAKEGAKVVVNDLGGAVDGEGGASQQPAEEVVALIKKSGGQAIANFNSRRRSGERADTSSNPRSTPSVASTP